MAFYDPFVQPVLVLVERQEPVLGRLQCWRTAAYGGFRVDQIGGIVRSTTVFTLISITGIITTFWAGSYDKTVR